MAKSSVSKTRLYELLGIQPDATDDQVKKAFRSKSMWYHPDRNIGDEEAANKFKDVQYAWTILGNPDRRSVYDETGDEVGVEVDNFLSRYADFVLNCYVSVVEEEIVDQNKDVNTCDIVKMMIERLKRSVTTVKKVEEKMVKILDQFHKSVDRFKAKDGGECSLGRMIRVKIVESEGQLEQCRMEIKTAIECQHYLAKYKYGFVRQLADKSRGPFDLPSGFLFEFRTRG